MEAKAAETRQAEVERFVQRWMAALTDGDAAAAGRLRAPEYSTVLPDGTRLGREEELALFASAAFHPERVTVEEARISVEEEGEAATAHLRVAAVMKAGAGGAEARYRCRLDLVRRDGIWIAASSRAENLEPLEEGAQPQAFREAGPRGLRRFVPASVRRRLRSWIRPGARGGGFQESAYLPYRPGKGFLLPPLEAPDPGAPLPIPPRHLWLDYNYPVHGKLHVDTMLQAVEGSGLALGPGDRILDLGCGAGRMIRHLEPLAGRCEIWGTDISAEHIFWCKRHLSPPFNFATTTKVPSLPFEDRSFALIYCGSLFTHIDDLADAWLLELHRILAPEGRLYLTFHDEHTMKLLDEDRYSWSQTARSFKSHPLYERARQGLGLLAMGRDDRSQVFYGRSFFTAMTDRMFETVATLEEAYFYQTALVLKRRARPDSGR